MKKLGADFYVREDVVGIARELLGKVLYTNINGRLTAGIITETEAYAGITDRASHAWNNRRTARTEIMYAEGGISYVYLCYGIHHLFNVVTNHRDVPHAVLVRAIRPTVGIDIMLERRKQQTVSAKTTGGPGTLSEALGIKTKHSGISLSGNIIWIADEGIKVKPAGIETTTRIGVDYAGKDALLPYRFVMKA